MNPNATDTGMDVNSKGENPRERIKALHWVQGAIAALVINTSTHAAIAQEQQTHAYTPVVATESGESCETPDPNLTETELFSCFWDSFSSEPDDGTKRLVQELWLSYSLSDRKRALGLFSGGFTAMEAIATVAANNGSDNRTEVVIRVIHAKAIDLGRREYVASMVASAPEFIIGRGANLSDADKATRAASYYDDIMENFLIGNDNDSVEKIVKHAPNFTQYVTEFPQDFPLAERLLQELQIAEGKSQIAEGESQIAEGESQIAEGKSQIAEGESQIAKQNLRIAALARLQNALESNLPKDDI